MTRRRVQDSFVRVQVSPRRFMIVRLDGIASVLFDLTEVKQGSVVADRLSYNESLEFLRQPKYSTAENEL